MKKIKLLTPILGLTALSGIMMPLVSCSCGDNWTITFEATAGGRITGSTTAKVKSGTKWSEVTKPTYAADAGYTFEDWYNGNNVMKETDEISSNITITAHFKSASTPVVCKTKITDIQQLIDMYSYTNYWKKGDPLDDDLWTKPLSQDPNPIKVITQDILFTCYLALLYEDVSETKPWYLDIEISNFNPDTKAITGLFYASPWGEKPDVPPPPTPGASSNNDSPANEGGLNVWVEFENIILDLREDDSEVFWVKPVMVWDKERQSGNWKVSGVYNYRPDISSINDFNELFEYDQNCTDQKFNEMVKMFERDDKYYAAQWPSYYYDKHLLDTLK